MSKPKVLIAITAIALVVPLTVTGQKGKPTKPPVPAVIEQDVNSAGVIVQVGRDVASYGLIDQGLYIHESLLPPSLDPNLPGDPGRLWNAGYSNGYYGPYSGQIRVLNDRIDYWFDTAPGCYQDKAPLCPFRLVVADGTEVYSGTGKRKTLVGIAFDQGRYLLDYRPCDPAAANNCYFKLYGCYDDRDCPGVPPGGPGYVFATVDVVFQ